MLLARSPVRVGAPPDDVAGNRVDKTLACLVLDLYPDDLVV